MRNIKHSLLILVSIFVSSCSFNTKKINESEKVDNFNNVARIINDRLIGKECRSILSLIPKEKIKSKDFIVFIYSIYDCDDCIKTGFEIVKLLDDNFPYQNTFVVSIMANSSVQQTRYEYFNYVYNDEGDTIRKQLNYVPTPIILHIDSDFRVKNLLIPNKNNNDEQEVFIGNFLKIQHPIE